MILVNFANPLFIKLENQGVWGVSAAYGFFVECAMTEPKPRRPFRIIYFLPCGEENRPAYKPADSIVVNVLDNQIASIQEGVSEPQRPQALRVV